MCGISYIGWQWLSISSQFTDTIKRQLITNKDSNKFLYVVILKSLLYEASTFETINSYKYFTFHNLEKITSPVEYAKNDILENQIWILVQNIIVIV